MPADHDYDARVNKKCDTAKSDGVRGALVLIGLRGSGKSTVGRNVAAQCHATFIDLDDRTRSAMGATTVSKAFHEQGEEAFRTAEVKALRIVIEEAKQTEKPVVVALGGGTPTAPGADDLLRSWQRDGAMIAYLRAEPEVLAQRLRANLGDRPSLTGSDPIEEIATVLAQRDGVYCDLADVIIDADASVDATTQCVSKAWGTYSSGQ